VLEIRTLRRGLLGGVAIVAGLGLAVELWHAGAPHEGLIEVLGPKLSLSYEGNVPTWFSSSLLLVCALAAGSIARGAHWRVHWWGLAVGFGYASLDEAAELHENLGGHFDTSGILYFDWVIPAVVILAGLAAVYLPFVRALPSATRIGLIVAGAIYVGGALGMELPLGWWTATWGPDGLGYALIDWVEEVLEMLGASLAVVALVAHRRREAGREVGREVA
jgi:hypothetical protein